MRDAHLEGEMRISRGREEMRISRAALGEAARHLVRSVCGGPNRAPGPGPGPGPVGSGSVRVRGSRRAMGPAVGPGGSRAEGGGRGGVGGVLRRPRACVFAHELRLPSKQSSVRRVSEGSTAATLAVPMPLQPRWSFLSDTPE